MQWWIWILLGFLLLLAELLTPGGFYLIFFGIAALIVGATAQASHAPAWLQWVMFSVISLAAIAFFRKPLLARFSSPPETDVDTLVGERGQALDAIAVGARGKVELRGSAWSAENVSDTPIDAGRACRVLRVDGLTLSVKPE